MQLKTRCEESYDALAKLILSKKTVIANLLKLLVYEFKNMSIKDIIPYIEDGGDNEYITGITNTDSSMSGEEIRFDIYFKVRSPIDDSEIIINIEPQYNKESYQMINRCEYYVSRMIDTQKGKEFYNSNYDDIKKVYSLWILINSNNKRNYIVNNYHPFNIIDYDNVTHSYRKDNNDNFRSLFNESIINLGPLENYDSIGIFELCCLLFKYDGLDNDSRLEKLKSDYGIILNKKEGKDMCSLDEGFRYEGKIINATSNVYNLIDSLHCSLDKAIDLLKIDDSIKEEVIVKVKEKLQNN